MVNKSNSELLKDRLIVLREHYKQNLIQKAITISNIRENIKLQKQVSQNFKELFLILHNLSGTGSTFGFVQITEHAKFLGQMVKSLQGENTSLNSEQLEQLDVLFQELLADMANPIDESLNSTDWISPELKGDNRLIYIVDDDVFFSEELSAQLLSSGYCVRTFSDPIEIFNQNLKHKPALIMMDMVFADAEYEGAEIIARYKNEIDPNVPVIFISVCDELESRLKALRSGSDYYMLKPLDYEHLLYVLTHVLGGSKKSPVRVLIIDDDEIIMSYYKMVLDEAGMIAEGVTHPQQALERIRMFEPDIILMDVNMPFCNGIELANVIRQYPKWISIPILFLTSETNYQVRNSAFDLGADEFILKPVTPQKLIRIVSNRTKRSRQLREISRELIENRQRTNNILETLQDVVWSVNPANWSLTFISTSSESVLGKTSDKLKISKDWRDYIYPDDRESVKAEMKKLSIQDNLEVVYRIKKSDGTIRWILENIHKVSDDKSNTIRFDGVIHDITAREIDKQNIKRRLMLESELAQFTRSLLQNNDIDQAFECLLRITDARVIQIFHVQTIEKHNDKYVCMFKFGDAVSSGLVENTISETRLHQYLQAMKSGSHQFVRGLHPNLKGKYDNLLIPMYLQNFWFGFISILLPENNPYHSIEELSLIKSATEILCNFFEKEKNVIEKRSQDRLLDTASRISRTLLIESDYHLALSASIQQLGESLQYDELYLLKITDSDSGFQILASHISNSIFKSQSTFLRIWDCMFNKFKDPILGKQSQLLDNNQFKSVFPNDTLGIKHFVIIPIAHAKTLWGVIVLLSSKHENHLRKLHLPILESIADSFGGALIRLKTQDELIEAKNQSEHANRSKSEFLANMSHEIRTPLNAIMGFAQLMKTTDLQAEIEEFSDLIHDSGNKLLSLITDVLDLSYVEIGKTHINKGDIDLNPIIKSVIKKYESIARHKKIEIGLMIPKTLPVFISDVDKIAKILDSLLSNAVKFTDKGKVTISISMSQSDVNALLIEVKDTGIGIPSEKQKIIFDAFEQADSSRTRRYSGIGLGLTLISRMVKILNGTIALDSIVGQGSCFNVTIPVELPLIEDKVLHKTRNSSPITVLAAEDNKVNRILLGKIFEKTSYQFHTVDNGAEVVKYLIDNPDVKLVLMDIHMPVMSGIEATLVIKSNPLLKHIPIIALTASVLQEDINVCFEAGMDDFLEKPLQTERLFSLIRKWCE